MSSPSNKGALISGSLLIVLGVIMLVNTFFTLSAWVWVAALVILGLMFFALYSTDTAQRWILIPTYIVWAVAGLIALIEINALQDQFIATYVLTAIGLPFLYVYLQDRTQWWGLLPAYIMLAIGVMVGLIGEGILTDLLIPAYVLLAIAFPFIVIYVRDAKQWWALIPGMIIGLVGFSFLLAGGAFKFLLPAMIILVGVWILLRQFLRPITPAVESSTPSIKEQDEPLSE